ncbi:hypothetical protein I308_105128 [Cryptococcus tetragattii IND107]|uniref:Uncharacterized protein n=1 Tax=Cryptococcus tetragattii IND107 TaxID=1296105 RepID=A0ABR3BM43_9TREE
MDRRDPGCFYWVVRCSDLDMDGQFIQFRRTSSCIDLVSPFLAFRLGKASLLSILSAMRSYHPLLFIVPSIQAE